MTFLLSKTLLLSKYVHTVFSLTKPPPLTERSPPPSERPLSILKLYGAQLGENTVRAHSQRWAGDFDVVEVVALRRFRRPLLELNARGRGNGVMRL